MDGKLTEYMANQMKKAAKVIIKHACNITRAPNLCIKLFTATGKDVSDDDAGDETQTAEPSHNPTQGRRDKRKRKENRKGSQSARSSTPALHNMTGKEVTEGTRGNNNKSLAKVSNMNTGEGGVLTTTDQDSPATPPPCPPTQEREGT